MIVKILGAIDLAAALAFLMLIFGMSVPVKFLMFCASLLFVKGLFVFTGDMLSIVDLFSAFILVISIFFVPPSIFLWMPGFFLLAKGIISFI